MQMKITSRMWYPICEVHIHFQYNSDVNFVDDSFGDFLYDVDNSTQNTMKPRRRRTTFSECVTVMLRETEGDIEYCDVEWVGWLVG